MNIHLVQTHNFSKDVLQNLLILLNKNRGIASFSALSTISVDHEDLSTRCIPCENLEKKFILERNLLKEIIRTLPDLGETSQYIQPGTFSDNSWYTRIMPGQNLSHLPELKKYTLKDLINGMLQVSFLKQSFPFPEQNHDCQPDRQHDVYTASQILFEKCKQLRQDHSLKKEDYLILLTQGNLDSNWIYTLDPAYGNNLIINACPLHQIDTNELPAALAFYIVTGLFAKLSYRSFMDWYLHQHPQPENCLMDFNSEHTSALRHIKTATICRRCQPIINEATISPLLFKQLNNILRNLRKEI